MFQDVKCLTPFRQTPRLYKNTYNFVEALKRNSARKGAYMCAIKPMLNEVQFSRDVCFCTI